MKRLAVLSAVHTAQLLNNNNTKDQVPTYNMSANGGNGRGSRFESDLHGNVNILLGGAMLGGVIVVVILVCYCCHRNMRKNRPHEYSQYWRPEPDIHSLEVFTMDSHAMCFERNASAISQAEESQPSSLPPRPLTPGPPPAYESLIFRPTPVTSPSDKKPDYSNLVGCILPVPIDAPRHQQQQQRSFKEEESRTDDEGLPSYEAALKLEAYGYV